jgi:hypothetical protein
MSEAFFVLQVNRPKRRAKRPERQLHAAVARFLNVALPEGAYWLPIPNGGSRNAIEAANMKASGEVKAGQPDLAVIYRGRVIGIELKVKGGRRSPAQVEAHKAWELAGAVVTVCRSIEEVSNFLAMLMPLKAQVAGTNFRQIGDVAANVLADLATKRGHA